MGKLRDGVYIVSLDVPLRLALERNLDSVSMIVRYGNKLDFYTKSWELLIATQIQDPTLRVPDSTAFFSTDSVAGGLILRLNTAAAD